MQARYGCHAILLGNLVSRFLPSWSFADLERLSGTCPARTIPRSGRRRRQARSFALECRRTLRGESSPFAWTPLLTVTRSLLLAYTLAEYEEAKGDFPVCYTIYDGLLAHFTAKLVGFEAATESETTTALAAIDAQVEQDETRAAEEIESEGVESRQRVIEQKEQATESIKARHATEVDSAKRAAANVWITEMRFARRAEVNIFRLLASC